jgi:hypothetical protein
VKKSLEITLTTLHVGSAKRVVTLGLNGKDLAHDFLLKLGKSNPQGLQSILKRLEVVAEHDRIENRITFRHVGDQVFEVKTKSGLRFYTFPDEVEGLGCQFIIAACGGRKGNKKEQSADISKAIQLRQTYLKAKQAPSTKLTLVPLPDED